MAKWEPPGGKDPRKRGHSDAKTRGMVLMESLGFQTPRGWRNALQRERDALLAIIPLDKALARLPEATRQHMKERIPGGTADQLMPYYRANQALARMVRAQEERPAKQAPAAARRRSPATKSARTSAVPAPEQQSPRQQVIAELKSRMRMAAYGARVPDALQRNLANAKQQGFPDDISLRQLREWLGKVIYEMDKAQDRRAARPRRRGSGKAA